MEPFDVELIEPEIKQNKSRCLFCRFIISIIILIVLIVLIIVVKIETSNNNKEISETNSTFQKKIELLENNIKLLEDKIIELKNADMNLNIRADKINNETFEIKNNIDILKKKLKDEITIVDNKTVILNNETFKIKNNIAILENKLKDEIKIVDNKTAEIQENLANLEQDFNNKNEISNNETFIIKNNLVILEDKLNDEIKVVINKTVEIQTNLTYLELNLKNKTEILDNKTLELKNNYELLDDNLKSNVNILEAKIKENFDIIKEYDNKIVEIDTIFPVGSYFLTSDATNPEKKIGGKWELIKDRFIIGAGNSYSVNSQGGEESHTLSIDEMPHHSHSISHFGGYFAFGGESTEVGPREGRGYRTQLSDLSTGWTGLSKPHNNIPPYIAAYIWHRIS